MNTLALIHHRPFFIWPTSRNFQTSAILKMNIVNILNILNSRFFEKIELNQTRKISNFQLKDPKSSNLDDLTEEVRFEEVKKNYEKNGSLLFMDLLKCNLSKKNNFSIVVELLKNGYFGHKNDFRNYTDFNFDQKQIKILAEIGLRKFDDYKLKVFIEKFEFKELTYEARFKIAKKVILRTPYLLNLICNKILKANAANEKTCEKEVKELTNGALKQLLSNHNVTWNRTPSEANEEDLILEMTKQLNIDDFFNNDSMSVIYQTFTEKQKLDFGEFLSIYHPNNFIKNFKILSCCRMEDQWSRIQDKWPKILLGLKEIFLERGEFIDFFILIKNLYPENKDLLLHLLSLANKENRLDGSWFFELENASNAIFSRQEHSSSLQIAVCAEKIDDNLKLEYLIFNNHYPLSFDKLNLDDKQIKNLANKIQGLSYSDFFDFCKSLEIHRLSYANRVEIAKLVILDKPDWLSDVCFNFLLNGCEDTKKDVQTIVKDYLEQRLKSHKECLEERLKKFKAMDYFFNRINTDYFIKNLDCSGDSIVKLDEFMEENLIVEMAKKLAINIISLPKFRKNCAPTLFAILPKEQKLAFAAHLAENFPEVLILSFDLIALNESGESNKEWPKILFKIRKLSYGTRFIGNEENYNFEKFHIFSFLCKIRNEYPENKDLLKHLISLM